MKTKIINTLMLWLLMIPLSGVLIIAYADEQPIEEPTHYANIRVVDVDGNPIDTAKVIFRLIVFGNDGYVDSEEEYGRTDADGEVSISISAPNWLPSDSIYNYLYAQLDESMGNMNIYQVNTDKYNVTDNTLNVTIVADNKPVENVKSNIEHTTCSADILVKNQNQQLLAGVKVKLRITYGTDDDDYVDSPICTTGTDGYARISISGLHSQLSPGYGFYYQAILDDDSYYMVSSSHITDFRGSGKMSPNPCFIVDQPKLTVRINNGTPFIAANLFRDEFSSLTIINGIKANVNQQVKNLLNPKTLNIAGLTYNINKAHTHFDGDNVDFDLFMNYDGTVTFNSSYPDFKVHCKLHHDWAPDYRVHASYSELFINGISNINQGTYQIEGGTSGSYIHVHGLGSWIINIIGNLFNVYPDLDYTFATNGDVVIKDVRDKISMLTTYFNDPVLDIIRYNNNWFFSRVRIKCQVNVKTGNVNLEINYYPSLALDNGYGPFTSGTYSQFISTGHIISYGSVNISNDAIVKCYAHDYVKLNPGFYAQAGSHFLASNEVASIWPTFGEKNVTQNLKVNSISINQNSNFGKVNKGTSENSITDNFNNAPHQFSLSQNYPNPFNPTTTIKYALKEDVKVSLKIYNTLGQEVRTLVNENQSAGFKEIMWDGKNNQGSVVPSGVYIYRLVAGSSFVKSNKMMLMK